MAQKNHQQTLRQWAIVALCSLLLLIGLMAALVFLNPSKTVTNFHECKDAGGVIMESYPEQCAIGGKTFRNEAQSINNNADEYIGLSEAAALEKAKAANKPARIVERDGEALPVDMMLLPGRLNMYVKEGNVYRVQVEGEA